MCLTKLRLNNTWYKLEKCDPLHFSPACSPEPARLLPKRLQASTAGFASLRMFASGEGRKGGMFVGGAGTERQSSLRDLASDFIAPVVI